MGTKNLVHGPIRQVGWMIVIWTMSVVGLGIFAMAFRLLMSSAGLTE